MRRWVGALGAAALVLLVGAVLGSRGVLGARSAPAGATDLTLVAYSTPEEVYAQLIPAFEATPAGRGVRFRQSFGASGAQSRAVAAGLQADIVNLSLEPDV